jgi:CRP-like cAMP-binding protein
MDPKAYIEEFLKEYPEDFAIKEFSRGEYIERKGSIAHHIYFVLEGAIRAYYSNGEQEFTVRFGYKDSVIASLDSFMSGQPTEYDLEVLRRTKVIAIKRNAYFDFVNSTIERMQVHQRLIEGIVLGTLEREVDLMQANPHDRYQRVLERSPQLFQEIPLKYIASYLRMTPETLSRIRNLDLNQGKET